ARPQLSAQNWVLPSVPATPKLEVERTGERYEIHLAEVERLADCGIDGRNGGNGARTIVHAGIERTGDASGCSSAETRSEHRAAQRESARPHCKRCEERTIDRRRNR